MNDYFPPILLGLGSRPAQYRMHLTVGEHSVRHIRRIVRSRLEDWELAGLTDAVQLAVTELVTNVVRHVPDRRCELTLLRQAEGVRVEVADGCPRLPRIVEDPAPDAEGGRGLLLLDAVVGEWGVQPRTEGGKTVWFECAAK